MGHSRHVVLRRRRGRNRDNQFRRDSGGSRADSDLEAEIGAEATAVSDVASIPSSGLAAKLNAAGLPFEVLIFDQEKIEKQLLRPSSLDIAKRFLPISFAKWQKEHPVPANLFREELELVCCYCRK